MNSAGIITSEYIHDATAFIDEDIKQQLRHKDHYVFYYHGILQGRGLGIRKSSAKTIILSMSI